MVSTAVVFRRIVHLESGYYIACFEGLSLSDGVTLELLAWPWNPILRQSKRTLRTATLVGKQWPFPLTELSTFVSSMDNKTIKHQQYTSLLLRGLIRSCWGVYVCKFRSTRTRFQLKHFFPGEHSSENFCCVGTHFKAFMNLADVFFLRFFSEARKKHFRRNLRKCSRMRPMELLLNSDHIRVLERCRSITICGPVQRSHVKLVWWEQLDICNITNLHRYWLSHSEWKTTLLNNANSLWRMNERITTFAEL